MVAKRAKKIKPEYVESFIMTDKQILAEDCPVKLELLKRFKTSILAIPKIGNKYDALIK